MPTVPTYNERQVSSSPLPANGFSAQSSPEHFGAGLAQAGDLYINAFAEAKQRANVALSQDALLQVQEYADDLFNNPNTGLYTKQGKNAVGQSDEIMASISAKGQELFMQLPEGSREDVVKQFNVVKRQYANQAKSYELKEIQSFETSRNNGAVAGYAKSASDNFNNPQAFISFMALGRHNIIEFNRSRGVSEEEISAKIAEFDNQVAWTAAQNAMATDAMGTIGAIGEPSDLGGSMRVTGGPSGDRGSRNNNPGNIRISDNNWEGQIGDDGEFVRFASPEHGVRALGKNLITYRNKGVVTINQIISRWAPKKDGNDTEGYIKFVSGKMGVDPNVPIDVTDINTLKSITTAIMQQEGNHSISGEQIDAGLQAALGLTRLPEPDPSQYQSRGQTGKAVNAGGNAWWPMLTPVQQYQIRKQGEAAQNKQRQEFKNILDDRLKDAEAQAVRGLVYANPPTLNGLMYANGEYEGGKKYEQLQKTLAMGEDIATVQYLSPGAQKALLESKKPTDDYDASNNWKRYDTLVRAVDTVNNARKADPIQFSIDREKLNQIDFSNAQSFTNSLKERSASVTDISNSYQTPLTVFSAQEEMVLSQLMEKAPASQKIEYLDAIRQGLKNNNNYTAALRQISKSDTSLAVAGIIMDKPSSVTAQSNLISSDVSVSPQDAAQLIVQGNMAIKSGKDFVMPKDAELRESFAEKVGDTFSGDISGASSAFSVAKDAYAGLMSKKGNLSGEYDDDTWTQAINIATGGIHDYNGMGNIMLPWGMDIDDFDARVNRSWGKIAPEVGRQANEKIGLKSFGDSQYLIKQGSGYILNKDGSPVVIDLTQEQIRDIPL
ncbi:hypothetical protein ISO71_17125 [Morganella morganii subsp. morganii]|uniref:hypothetical protein n=1 Tax=Morganella morganii TaxID=582 RepID=UPI0006620EAA|nr:hypothetical protein [Morganella morganii]AVD60283.1 hypothetical protein C4E49_13175 [Morganella morganii]EKW8498984.1 hypothetical protein [Morganella morganii]MBT0429692.1 hypothetical protein [Morganella morganii subsp. morganii]MBT0454838.1 hypothetical protein [Morganella morganii subsp. morganii]MBT0477350.1 hypothetical protein [Morganella morganii subsp. morganii]